MGVLWGYLGAILGKLKFIAVVFQFQNGILLRMGKYKRVLKPGWHFIRPLGIDHVLAENITVDTAEMGTQSLTTKDGTGIQLELVITYHIFDVRRFLLEAEDASSALTDTATGYVQEVVASHTWEQIRQPRFSRILKKHIQKQARKWGIAVTNAQFVSLVSCPTIRILQD